MTPQPPHDALVLEPAPAEWLDRVRAAPPPTPEARATRATLGLPATGLLLASGHQAEFFHPGVIAKAFALRAAANRFRRAGLEVHTAWFVVDFDTNDPGAMRYPAGDPENPTRRTYHALGTPPARDVPTGFTPAIGTPAPPPADGALPCVTEGLALAARSLERWSHEPSRAMQVTRAALSPAAAGASDLAIIPATRLSTTPLFGALVRAYRESPDVARAYEHAVRSNPRAGVRPLAPGEAPFWVLAPGAPRRPAMLADLADPTRLAPRALTLTRLLRGGVCDLFIHGLGGWRYDAAMEDWARAAPAALPPPAPRCLVTATRRLPLGPPSIPTPEAIARAAWLHHRARSDPGALGDPESGLRARALAAAIAAIPRHDPSRAARYAELLALRAASRDAHARALARLADGARDARSLGAVAGIAHDRTWPAAIHPSPAIASLDAQIERAFAEAPSRA